ncbi:MmcB family DNA repair protein [Calidifontibacillus erzurumensis]|uniref:MmcB family DNA repair protein n=1 Tax=Calidifontibacillus erzurumensis TaxID=2741433 RepID=UPI0035B523AE
MTTITGTDKKSLEILESLEAGTKVKDIPGMFGVSIDQAKRLSRYRNMLKQAKDHLAEPAIAKIKIIGLKTLYLAPLFKHEDWEGLTEVLSAVNENTKRDDLPLLIEALKEKRKRMEEFQADIDRKLAYLEQREKDLKQLEDETNQLMKKIKEETKFLSKYPQTVQDFLIKHLGIYGDKLVLARRLDSRWQKALKNKGVLSYDNQQFIWLVNDLDKLVEEYESRTKRKYPTEWKYEREEKRSKDYLPSTPEYKLPTGLTADLLSSMKEINEKMKRIEIERKGIQEEIQQLKKTSPQSFIEQVKATNALSVYDLKRHGEMQDKALKWLYSKGYVVASEVTLPNGKRCDVIGYNNSGHLVIIEIKVSLQDFIRDEKWETYLEYCDEFYFFLSKEVQYAYYEKHFKNVGLLEESKNTLRIKEKHSLLHTAKEREEVKFSISRTVSKKFVYGY